MDRVYFNRETDLHILSPLHVVRIQKTQDTKHITGGEGGSNDIKCLQYKAREVIQLNVLSICAFFQKHIKYVSQNNSPCAVNVCPVATQFSTKKSAPSCHLFAPHQLTYCDT
jgi:hypothetical protein